MGDTKQEVAALKDRLNQYRELARELEAQIERLERLESKMTGVGIKVITDMPITHDDSSDRLAGLVDQKDEIESSIREIVKKQHDERTELESVISNLRHSDQKSVIRLRYFDCMEWSDVCFDLYGSRQDYVEKEESYKRRAHKLHGLALLNMAKCIEQSEQAEFPA